MKASFPLFTLPAVLGGASTNAHVAAHNSILFEPGTQLAYASVGAGVDLRNLLISDTTPNYTGDPTRNVNTTSDPMFVNPGQDNFALQIGSPARNRWSPGNDVDVPVLDLLGAARPAPGDTVTPCDFGAVRDRIFADPFDVGGYPAHSPQD